MKFGWKMNKKSFIWYLPSHILNPTAYNRKMNVLSFDVMTLHLPLICFGDHKKNLEIFKLVEYLG